MGLIAWARRVVASPAFSAFISVVIIINAVTLGMQTSDAMLARWGSWLSAADDIALAIFTVEILLRAALMPRVSLRDPWFWFDFSVVAVCYVPATGPASVLRTLRLFRVLRLVSVIPSLRSTVQGLLGALPGMGSVIMLLGLVFYVGAVIATELFGDNFPEYFGTLGASLYSLFQIMTLESWSQGIVRPVMEVHPNAWAFFVPFIVVSSFAVLNMFIGVIVSSIEADSEVDRREYMDAFEARLMDRLAELETRLAASASPDTGAATPPDRTDTPPRRPNPPADTLAARPPTDPECS